MPPQKPTVATVHALVEQGFQTVHKRVDEVHKRIDGLVESLRDQPAREEVKLIASEAAAQAVVRVLEAQRKNGNGQAGHTRIVYVGAAWGVGIGFALGIPLVLLFLALKDRLSTLWS